MNFLIGKYKVTIIFVAYCNIKFLLRQDILNKIRNKLSVRFYSFKKNEHIVHDPNKFLSKCNNIKYTCTYINVYYIMFI